MLSKAYVDCIKQTIQQGWTQRHFAVDVEGEAVLPTHESAVKFCVLGAAMKCSPEPPQYDGQAFRGVVFEFVSEFSRVHNAYVSAYNDVPFRTVEQMIAALDALSVEVSNDQPV